MDFVNTFDNCDKLRNGITIRFMRILKTGFFLLETVFTSCFPVNLNKYTFGTLRREMFYLYHKITGAAVETKTLVLHVTI